MSKSGTIKFLVLLSVFIFGLQGSIYSQVLINEIMASNAKTLIDKDYGKYCDWIELYNNSVKNVDLGGYFLTDHPANPAMWKFQPGIMIPAHGYLLVYADGTGSGKHTNFSLGKEGEHVLLINKQMAIVDSISYPYQLTDVSFGRKRNEPQVFGYFDLPSPGIINNYQILKGICPEPVFTVKGGFLSGSQSVEIMVASPDAEIFYTLDGTEPTTASTPYTTPILITETSVLRAKSFVTGFLPGLTITQTYFIDEPVNLPVISLVTDPDNFFSDETGIYVVGTAGVAGYCTSVPHNVNQDWERPVNIELFEKDGTVGLNQLAGVSIFGGCSRVRYPIKSLALYARKEYETSSFKYQLFPDKSCSEYETFILRTSADDQPFTLFRDALTQTVVKDVIDIDVMAYRPVVLYINGKYWGIHNMREKINEHYINDNYGANTDSVNLLERNPAEPWNTIYGNANHYNSMIAYLHNNDITQKTHYDYLCKQMDVDEYINYQITQIFFGGRDWPGNNIKFWRGNEKPYDRWRWILCDLDFTFREYFSDIMDEATKVDCGCTWPNPPWSTYLFRRLLENENFRDEFIQRFFLFSESHFSRERIHRIIDEMQSVIAPEIPRHIERWGGQKTNLPDNTWVTPIFSSVEEWEGHVQLMRDFTDTRHEIAKKQVMDYFSLSGLIGFNASVEPAGLGSIVTGNAVITNTAVSADLITGDHLEVSCKPEPGYILSHWDVKTKQETDSTLIARGDSWLFLESWEGPAYDWMLLNYDDGYWDTGNAEFGYGDGDEATVLNYGGDSLNKMMTAWFRKKFIIEDKTVFTRYTLHLLRDDGARVFLNGKEVIRDNLDRWWVGNSSPAFKNVTGTDESYFNSYQLNPALFTEGENIIAIEVHQFSSTSPDLSFNLDLQATHLTGDVVTTSVESKLSLIMNDNISVTAHIIPEPRLIEKITINEVMAKNSSGFTDESGEYEDWIELYNEGSDTVDLAGLYLSDTIAVTEAWRIPEGFPEQTSILPNGYMVFITDKETSEGLLHTGFSLDKDGDEIALLQLVGNDFNIIDHFQFGEQNGNVSWGRYPDGSEIFEFMPLSTPGTSNYREPVIIPSASPSFISEDMSIYPVPTNGSLFVKFNTQIRCENVPVQINIYSATGRLISMTQHHTSELIELSLENQPTGLYMVRVITGDKVYERKTVLY